MLIYQNIFTTNKDHADKEKNTTSLDQHFTKRYGKRGSAKRIAFEVKAKAFLIRQKY